MSGFTGTWTMARLFVRRDRVRIPVWAFSIAVLVVASVAAFPGLYETHEAIDVRNDLLMGNPFGIALTGAGYGLEATTPDNLGPAGGQRDEREHHHRDGVHGHLPRHAAHARRGAGGPVGADAIGNHRPVCAGHRGVSRGFRRGGAARLAARSRIRGVLRCDWVLRVRHVDGVGRDRVRRCGSAGGAVHRAQPSRNRYGHGGVRRPVLGACHG